MLKRKIKFLTTTIIRYEVFILIGFIIAIGALIKVLGICDFSSDWFWFFVGIGLVIEGIISFIKQRKFSRKYKVIEK